MIRLQMTLAALLLGCFLVGRAGTPVAADAEVRAAFRGECEKELLKAIADAERDIFVAAYTFSRDAVADALIARAKEGVRIKVKMDAQHADSRFGKPIVSKLRRHRISVYRIQMPGLSAQHNKFMVLDRQVVITGSYNYSSAAAEQNWENVLIVRSRQIARDYIAEWEKITSKTR